MESKFIALCRQHNLACRYPNETFCDQEMRDAAGCIRDQIGEYPNIEISSDDYCTIDIIDIGEVRRVWDDHEETFKIIE